MKTMKRGGKTAKLRMPGAIIAQSSASKGFGAVSACRAVVPRTRDGGGPSRRFAISSDKTAEGGFILWEVLLAFGIFCLTAIGFIAALEQTIFTVTLVRDEAEIRHDFENFFAEARAEKLQPGTQTLNTSDNRIRYERQVQAIKAKNQQGADVPNLFQITLTARWTFQNQERSDEAKLIVYQP
jgi:hypothetical protein